MPSKKQESDSQFNMDCLSNTQESSQHYSTITYQTRLKLIELVLNQKYSVLRASKQLQIKLSTAKFILNTYKKKGKVMKRKRQIKKDQKKQLQNSHENSTEIKSQQQKVQKQQKTQAFPHMQFPMEIMYFNYNPYWFLQFPFGINCSNQ